MNVFPPGLGEYITLRKVSSIDQYGDPTYIDSSVWVIWFDEMKKSWEDGHAKKICDAFCLTQDSTVTEGDALTRNGLTWPILDIATTEAYGMIFRVVNLSKNQA